MQLFFVFFFQAEDGIRDLVRSRGLGDVYKRQAFTGFSITAMPVSTQPSEGIFNVITKVSGVTEL